MTGEDLAARGDFIRSVFADLSLAMAAVPTGEQKGFEERRDEYRGKLMDRYYDRFIESSRSGWQESLAIIHKGCVDGTIVLRTRDDIEVFFFLLYSRFLLSSPHIVEHYIEADEFMDVLTLLKSAFEGYQNRRWLTTSALLVVREKMDALYDFDTKKQREVIEDTAVPLPLEVRAGLSGFYDDEKRGQ